MSDVKLKVYKTKENNNNNQKYLKDFFSMYEYLISCPETSCDNIIFLLSNSIKKLFIIRLLISYEDAHYSEEKINYKQLISSNREYIKLLKQKKNEIEERLHRTSVSEQLLSDINLLLNEYDDKVLEGYIHNSKHRESLAKGIEVFTTQMFDFINRYGVDLGTKAPSKRKGKNINHTRAEQYYEVIVNRKLREEFKEYLYGRISTSDTSDIIKDLFNNVPIEKIVEFYNNIEGNSIEIELFLLFYLCATNMNSFKINDIERYFDEDTLESIKYQGIASADDSISKLSLSNRLIKKEVLINL